jgi:enoyl-CoA hydratase/carnithine racemase
MTDGPGTVTVVRDGAVAVVTLCRPAKLNALSAHMETALLEAMESAEVRDSAAVVLTGGPTVFSAGADVRELAAMAPDAIADYYRGSGRVYEVVAALAQPTVAAIAGWCVGGGFELALATDVRVADETAVFSLPEVSIGIVPSSGGTYRLTRAVGPARARDLVLRGRRLGADEALSWGLVAEVLPAGAHVTRAVGIAHELARQPRHALAAAKQLIAAVADTGRDASLLLEQLAYRALTNTGQSR